MTRRALITDIPEILSLINGYATREIMLPRSEFERAESIRDFWIAEDGGLRGCGALHFYTPRSAEARSLAVAADNHHHGLGRRIVEALEAAARTNGICSLFAFT